MEPWMGIRVGDLVEIVNCGHIYSTFGRWAADHNLTYYVDGCNFQDTKGFVGEVVAVDVHTHKSDSDDDGFSTHDDPTMVACIRIKHERRIRDVIIGLSGLEFRGQKQVFSDDLFTL